MILHPQPMMLTTRVTLKHGERTFVFDHKWCDSRAHADREYEESAAEYMWRDGNYGCDCNRSLFIARNCDEDFPEMPCGETIELVSLEHA